jgi:hypothetical protein
MSSDVKKFHQQYFTKFQDLKGEVLLGTGDKWIDVTSYDRLWQEMTADGRIFTATKHFITTTVRPLVENKQQSNICNIYVAMCILIYFVTYVAIKAASKKKLLLSNVHQEELLSINV